jgi:hypothetical protein
MFRRDRHRVACISAVLPAVVAALALPVAVQGAEPLPGRYELRAESVFNRGCYPPCRCALFSQPGVTGRFVLEAGRLEDGWLIHAVSDVEWVVPGEIGITATGSGEYRVELADVSLERMTLFLRLEGPDGTVEENVRFDSGELGRRADGETIELDVSVNGKVCADTVFEVRAKLAESAVPSFVRSDCDDDGSTNITDAVVLLRRLFLGEPAPAKCDAACDSNGDRNLDVSDAIYTLSYLFAGGAAPPEPYPACDVSQAGEIGCDSFTSCP